MNVEFGVIVNLEFVRAVAVTIFVTPLVIPRKFAEGAGNAIEYALPSAKAAGIVIDPPVAAAAAGGAAGGAAADAAQDEFTIILEDAGSQKIAVIKEVRALNSSLGLKEAKDLVDATPATIMEKADKATADKAKAAFEAAGAKVTIK